MKKLKLSLQNIEGVEILSRSQLKSIGGGTEGHQCGPHTCSADQYCDYTPPSAGSGSGYKCKDIQDPAPLCATDPAWACGSGYYCSKTGCMPW